MPVQFFSIFLYRVSGEDKHVPQKRFVLSLQRTARAHGEQKDFASANKNLAKLNVTVSVRLPGSKKSHQKPNKSYFLSSKRKAHVY